MFLLFYGFDLIVSHYSLPVSPNPVVEIWPHCQKKSSWDFSGKLWLGDNLSLLHTPLMLCKIRHNILLLIPMEWYFFQSCFPWWLSLQLLLALSGMSYSTSSCFSDYKGTGSAQLPFLEMKGRKRDIKFGGMQAAMSKIPSPPLQNALNRDTEKLEIATECY